MDDNSFRWDGVSERTGVGETSSERFECFVQSLSGSPEGETRLNEGDFRQQSTDGANWLKGEVYTLREVRECHQEFRGGAGFVNATAVHLPIEW